MNFFGRVWTFKGLLKDYLDIYGHFWTLRDTLEHWTFKGLLKDSLNIFGHFGTLWTLLDTFGHFGPSALKSDYVRYEWYLSNSSEVA